jgi:hypothetical protein
MGASPRRLFLYRNARLAVTLLGCAALAWTWFECPTAAAQGTIARYGRKPVSKGPRALGLIQLYPNGKARLIPVAITVDGKFYDAGSYKANPVPMALDFDVVYEGFRTGVSQGLFTITQPGQLNHVWMAEGLWLPTGVKAPEKGKKYETPVIEDKDAPPRLHRGSEKPSPDSGAQKPAPPGPAPPAPVPPANPPKPPDAAKTAPAPEGIEDPNRPVLRRGKPDTSARRDRYTTFDEPAPAKSAKDGGSSVETIPAISDAGGPDPRSYAFDLRPGEETTYRSKMLELASAELRAKARTAPPSSGTARPGSKAPAASKGPQAAFEDVHMRIFDLSNANEPVLVLSAKTRGPATAGGGNTGEPEEITLIARTNLEGEIRKLFFSKTDSGHLGVAPRMELIDAVDADGDGRGELLFRFTSDAGSAYAIYRVTADRLWELYEGTP